MLEPVLSVASPLWALTNSVARAFLSGSAHRLRCPVLSVGNIVAGGVGKTELAALIAARLVAEGRRVVVASRGYGSSWEREGGVAFDAGTALARRFPDEAIVVLRKASGAAVAVGADRFGVLTKHWDELRPDVVLLDDGFQHFKISRELDILVHDFSVRWPVLRDLPSMLARAQVRVALSEVPAKARGQPWVRARYKLNGAVGGGGQRTALPREALAFCGLGNPSRFQRALERAGVQVAGFKTYADHFQFGLKEAKELAAWAASQSRPLALLTSLKDYVKLEALLESRGGVAGFEPLWVPVELEFLENERLLWEAVQDKVRDTMKGSGGGN